ncbi:hypothetical protein VIGAN_01365600 [Vigna angularis var. angularis]|uniref:Uncharacterized protein n=1 Tax=Vigna angularis var. angularis TaxID=157739 RepID=A0A0S3R5H4_PHAAN|nr:hypothetical protein VIGAN_01365600 [Vigna angularis var. angularis]
MTIGFVCEYGLSIRKDSPNRDFPFLCNWSDHHRLKILEGAGIQYRIQGSYLEFSDAQDPHIEASVEHTH